MAISSLSALELNRVIVATNDNPNYIEFWPIVAPLWEEMGLRPTLALVADEECVVDSTLGDVIRFKPLSGIPTSLQAQVIRLLLPTLFPDDGCIISDIDMLPISRSYFFESARACAQDAFVIYRDGAYDHTEKKYPMCYFAAKGRTFASVFNVSNLREMIEEWASYGWGWNTDELVLYKFVNQWSGEVIHLGHGVGPRLDRLYWESQMVNLERDIGYYIDCHCPRPYSENRETIDAVVREIRKSWNE